MTTMTSVVVQTEFEPVVAAVRAALAEEGFGVITEIDVRATMAEKLGEDYPPFLILGACNPALAHRAIQTDPGVGTLLPCNVVVRAADEGTVVEAVDPQVLVSFTGIEALAPVADDATARIQRVLKQVSGA